MSHTVLVKLYEIVREYTFHICLGCIDGEEK